MRSLRLFLLFTFSLPVLTAYVQALPEPRKRGAENESNKVQAVVRSAVSLLIQMQERDGRWPYNDNSDFLASQVANTSIVAEALLLAAPDDKNAQAAAQRGLAFVLKQLDHPNMAVGGTFTTWGHAFALEFLCQVRAHQIAGKHQKQVAAWIQRLIKSLIEEQFPCGGWGHQKGDGPFTFATAPVVLTLLWARSQGEKIPDAIFERARQTLKESRIPNGAFSYGITKKPKGGSMPESIARSAVCELTLVLLGGGSIKAVRGAVENFFWNWEELEKRRGEDGHGGPYRIGSHYIYYAHRYVAQAIQMLPEKERTQKQDRLLKLLLQTRNDDGTWNDNDLERHRSYGTAMVVLALLSDKVLPPKWTKKP